jgi:hypothetical protein
LIIEVGNPWSLTLPSKNALDRCCGVGVAQSEQVSILGESVDHCQDHTLAMNTREAVDEIHSDVGPHLRWHLKRLEEASGV